MTSCHDSGILGQCRVERGKLKTCQYMIYIDAVEGLAVFAPIQVQEDLVDTGVQP